MAGPATFQKWLRVATAPSKSITLSAGGTRVMTEPLSAPQAPQPRRERHAVQPHAPRSPPRGDEPQPPHRRVSQLPLLCTDELAQPPHAPQQPARVPQSPEPAPSPPHERR
jgi:hypothetical protein